LTEAWPQQHRGLLGITCKTKHRGLCLMQQVRSLLGAECAGPLGFCYVASASSPEKHMASYTGSFIKTSMCLGCGCSLVVVVVVAVVVDVVVVVVVVVVRVCVIVARAGSIPVYCNLHVASSTTPETLPGTSRRVMSQCVCLEVARRWRWCMFGQRWLFEAVQSCALQQPGSLGCCWALVCPVSGCLC